MAAKKKGGATISDWKEWNEYVQQNPFEEAIERSLEEVKKDLLKTLDDATIVTSKSSDFSIGTRVKSRIKKHSKVETPHGPGVVWLVDQDNIVCVELDHDPGLVYEFDMTELLPR